MKTKGVKFSKVKAKAFKNPRVLQAYLEAKKVDDESNQSINNLKDVKMSDELDKLISNAEESLRKIREYVKTSPVVNEPKHVKTWEDLDEIDGYYVDGGSYILPADGMICNDESRNTFPLARQAESVIALAQLLQLRQEFLKREGYDPDWDYEDNQNARSNICMAVNGDFFTPINHEKSFLSFPTDDLADKFISLYRDLLTQYFDGM